MYYVLTGGILRYQCIWMNLPENELEASFPSATWYELDDSLPEPDDIVCDSAGREVYRYALDFLLEAQIVGLLHLNQNTKQVSGFLQDQFSRFRVEGFLSPHGLFLTFVNYERPTLVHSLSLRHKNVFWEGRYDLEGEDNGVVQFFLHEVSATIYTQLLVGVLTTNFKL